MTRFNVRDHHAAVNAFFEACAQDDPVRYAEVCDKYPVLTRDQHRANRRRERQVGLLGLQPSYIPSSLARRCGFESVYDDFND